MTTEQQQAPIPARPTTSVDLAVRSRVYLSTACIAWGVVLGIAAVIMIVAGWGSTDDGSGNGDLQMLGVMIGALGAPLLLVGLIAAGVRLGLRDHAADQARRLGD